jgi:hypothetical protein
MVLHQHRDNQRKAFKNFRVLVVLLLLLPPLLLPSSSFLPEVNSLTQAHRQQNLTARAIVNIANNVSSRHRRSSSPINDLYCV